MFPKQDRSTKKMSNQSNSGTWSWFCHQNAKEKNAQVLSTEDKRFVFYESKCVALFCYLNSLSCIIRKIIYVIVFFLRLHSCLS